MSMRFKTGGQNTDGKIKFKSGNLENRGDTKNAP